jgi:hypothetical protein
LNSTPVTNQSPSRRPSSSSSQQSEGKNALSMSGLREVNPNLTTTNSIIFSDPPASSILSPTAGSDSNMAATTMLKPNTRTRISRLSKKPITAVAEGPENVPPASLRSSTRRKSPRLR